MNQHYGKAFGHLLMAFGLAAFGERPEDEIRASDQAEPYGAGPGPEAELHRAPAEAPNRACCLARRKVSPLRRIKR